MKFNFGKTQYIASEKMESYPNLSKLFYWTFGYTNVGNYARSKIVIRLFNSLPLKSFSKILDLGAGLGEFTFMLAEKMPEKKITALEILPDRIERLKLVIRKGNFKNVVIHGDYIQSLSENDFDLIFAVDVFEHIKEDEMPFKQAFERLKPGGYLMVKIPNIVQKTIFPDQYFEEHQDWLDDEHIGQVYDLSGLEDRFKREGFEISQSYYSDGIISRLAWELGYLTKKWGLFTQLLFLPVCKFLIYIDLWIGGKKIGNAIQVIGRKPI
jgi:2-polyprenyl-3-methyl-5-hydroxy-6-metoxy-1,4-benzoquinol methylase